VLTQVLTLNIKTMEAKQDKCTQMVLTDPAEPIVHLVGDDSHGGYGVGSASCISWSQTEIIHRVASIGRKVSAKLVSMAIVEEPTIRNEYSGLRHRVDIPVGGPYTLHLSAFGTSRSEVLSGVGQSVSEGLRCKTLWVPIKALRLESRDLYSIIPYAPGAEQPISNKTKTR
jgi:hypothetical protein